ncbi:MAG: MotA/TolQ/ExbB proton channel family protein [Pseudomonadota bacterium]|jgi:biopolymer transport protein ExbB|nr:MAG: flagellar motor protein MotA [Pseudomonadota bacterium]
MNEDVAAAVDPASNPYGFGALIEHGNSISYTILGVLLIMSLGTWWIFFTKFWDQYKLNKAARNVEKNFWSAGSAKEGAERLPKDDDFRVIAESAIRAAGHYEGRLNDRISMREWLGMTLNRSVDTMSSKLGSGLSFLATVGSTAPFVGLIGTVYGILNALIKIGLSGQPSIDQVAGPVGEALIMTALGLVVAVPAVICYNVLLKRNKTIMESVRDFTGDIEANLIGGVKPEVVRPVVAPAAAAPAANRK